MTFPTYGCIVSKDYTETLAEPKRYLGGRSFEDQAKVSFSILFTMDEYKSFLDWYYNDISAGSDAFTMDFSFFGIPRSWLMKIANEIKAKPSGSDKLVSMTMVFQENISNYVT